MTLISNFSKGWQNTVQQEDMNKDAQFMCKDCDVGELGVIKCRKLHKEDTYFAGLSLTSEINNFYQTDVEGSGTKLVYYTSGVYLYRWNSATGITTTLSSAMVGNHVSYAPLKPVLSTRTHVFITDGVTQLCDDGTSSKTWGIDAPTVPLDASTVGSGGNLSAGDYSYVYTFYDNETGTESDPSPVCADFTALANDSVTLTNIEISINSRVTGRKIYRTIADGGTKYLVTTIPDNVTTTFLDTITDDNLVTELNTDQGTPPEGDVVFSFRNRLWMIEPDYPNRVRYSRSSRPDSFPSTYFLDVGTADDELCNFFELDGALYTLGDTNIFRLYGDDADTYDFVKTRSHVGTDCRWSVAVGPDGAYFMRKKKGVYRFDGLKSALASEGIKRTFELSTETWVDIVDRSSVESEARAGFIDSTYWLLVPIKDSDGDISNRLFAYDSGRPSGSQTWSMYKTSCDDIFADKGRGILYGCMSSLSSDGYYSVYELFSVNQNSNDSASPEFVTKSFPIVVPRSYGVTSSGFVASTTPAIGWLKKFRLDALGSWDVTVYVDGRSAYTRSLTGLTAADRGTWYDVETKLKGRYFYLHLEATGTPGPVIHKIREIEVE